MTALAIAISEAVVAKFPDVQVSALRAQIPTQTALLPARRSLDARMGTVGEEVARFDPITDMPEIACWREAYQGLGVKPSKFPSSIEALLRRMKKGDDIDIGIPAVDLYNAISVLNRAPMGAYDVAKLTNEPLILRNAKPDEDHFEPLGGRSESFPLNLNLVVYAQGAQVLCWGFNSRDSVTSSVDDSSKDIVFFSESTDEKGRIRAVAALDELSSLISNNGGTIGPRITIDASNPAGNLT